MNEFQKKNYKAFKEVIVKAMDDPKIIAGGKDILDLVKLVLIDLNCPEYCRNLDGVVGE
jgi:hypothetical protein